MPDGTRRLAAISEINRPFPHQGFLSPGAVGPSKREIVAVTTPVGKDPNLADQIPYEGSILEREGFGLRNDRAGIVGKMLVATSGTAKSMSSPSSTGVEQ
ncbi:hypothetical protein [Rhodococcus sp. OK302]|uniref:hypothetical protein n=1 Tax=Rhodococcus sp. OK302 TaxID=1882769 RepID=UPI000B94252B|nr:hypothetical protein [Rhodococcus sp. OK302]OYD61352.1 hypothetical protein BDB13_6325 [Rhodococcus sp. OK302]